MRWPTYKSSSDDQEPAFAHSRSPRYLTCTSIQRTRVGDVGSGSPPERAERHAARMHPIHLHTVADLLAHHHTLGLYCPRCDRWAEAPLTKLAARGLADRPIQRLNFRCVMCGKTAQCQLRPPALSSARPSGWMEPRTPAAPTTPRGDPESKQHPPKATPLPPIRRRSRRRWVPMPWNNSVEH